MTNYFLMSLAVADLLVCLIVMPFGAIIFFSGNFGSTRFHLTKLCMFQDLGLSQRIGVSFTRPVMFLPAPPPSFT